MSLDNITEKPIENRLAQWLADNNATIAVFAVAPTGEKINISNVVIPALLQSGWKIGFQAIEHRPEIQ